ncbi:UDP-N-acetylmuramate-alanine ligase [Buchnera aphidicola str. Bp (Baizongia pistaciae)]|uniref:UDP-N-acetylmuramate--L-alanine ligase n=1 Tax=Buchnera aphidicola subsp. Baizongia pistaciae (strain Bp) TaxID=224915 RepID=MURC_BUCBP|nr:UDP-N-acetylmuramate--L-alanine ligase [Buchnera aphidicola]P59418.1 RecName: Full=UDP-N-acetylmuramate--L-alanine ligase; AltName: Full=UDP-N-acetylmuramoyl-L-alanine synthetase [Buchnera aphidicola str. Bp (Baizongia pistaciae)]AAO26929.1 UDP-N-acetylmuramate-alanine ligase [Buchnera aphidicola str. Bp (Baizongia pistaciae)]
MNNKKKNINTISIIKMNDIKNIHFIGIGGCSMGGIAEILLKSGYNISGSDIVSNNITQQLSKLGAKIFFKHTEKNINRSDVIVISSAISCNNPEIIKAKKLNIPVISRAEMIAEIIRYKYNIAISGTHGKTSTTAIIFSIFEDSNLSPTLINGGYLKSINSNIKIGKNPFYCIVEADESDASFLHLKPITIILTNIEKDHIETYNGSFHNLKLAFIKFIHNLPFYGTAIMCIDNHAVQTILPYIKRNIITYGFSSNADVRIDRYVQKKFTSRFIVIRVNKPTLNVTLNLPGRHNALNATAAICVATQENIDDKNIIQSLKNFQGVQRRFELSKTFTINSKSHRKKEIMLINDYGHHPTEILESIHTARFGWPKKKLLMIFQPHRYTRTKNFLFSFSKTLSNVDELFILEVYAANEAIIPGADSTSLYKTIKKNKKNFVTLILDLNKLFLNIMSKLSDSNLILVQGAGNVDNIVKTFFIKKLKQYKN